MMSKCDLKGIYPVAPTPFLPNGEIDHYSIGKLVTFYESLGVDGITILGLLGESAKLNSEESLDVIKSFLGYAKQLNIIVGASASGFASMKYIASRAMEMGAVAVMIGPSPVLRTNDQVTGYYDTVVSVLGDDIPFIIQDYPLVNQVIFSNNVLKDIVERNRSCIAIKHEDWPGLEKLRTLKDWMANGSMRTVPLLVGNGGLFVDFEYTSGADGAMTGYPFPEMLMKCLRLAKRGDFDQLHDVFDLHLPYLRYEAQPKIGLAIRKYVLKLRGAICHDTQRKPYMAMTEKTRKDVDYLIARLIAKTDIKLKVL